MRIVAALDEGTSSLRAALFTEEGRFLRSVSADFQQFTPSEGVVEHDPVEIWQKQERVLHEALAAEGRTMKDLVAIGVTNQRETVVVWDRKTGIPIYNAIVWQDTRGKARCASLSAHGFGTIIQEKTGLLISPYFSATKIEWILENVAGARTRAENGELAFGTVDSWLIFNLTNKARHVTDHTNASRTMLYNIHTGTWDDELLKQFGVPRAMLPEVVHSSGVCGEYRGVPISGIAGDQQAALYGQACVDKGMIKNTYGTGFFMLMNVGDRAVTSNNKLLTTVGLRNPGRVQYALEGAVFNGGSVIKWARDKMRWFSSISELEKIASTVTDSAGLTFVPALSGLGAPVWDSNARGSIEGLSLAATQAHIMYAMLEGLALQTADLIRAMESDSGIAISELRVDGGASRNNLLMQMQADILGVPIKRSKVAESTAQGVAYLALNGVGILKGTEEVKRAWEFDGLFEPRISEDERQSKLYRWNHAIRHARDIA